MLPCSCWIHKDGRLRSLQVDRGAKKLTELRWKKSLGKIHPYQACALEYRSGITVALQLGLRAVRTARRHIFGLPVWFSTAYSRAASFASRPRNGYDNLRPCPRPAKERILSTALQKHGEPCCPVSRACFKCHLPGEEDYFLRLLPSSLLGTNVSPGNLPVSKKDAAACQACSRFWRR